MINDIRELIFMYGKKFMLKMIFLLVIIAVTIIVFMYELMSVN